MTNMGDLIKLIEAGFTKDDIMAFNQSKTEPVKEEPAAEPVKEPEETPVTVDTGSAEVDSLKEEIALLRDAMTEMRKTFQADAVKNARMTAPEKPSAENILAEWLNPTTAKEK